MLLDGERRHLARQRALGAAPQPADGRQTADLAGPVLLEELSRLSAGPGAALDHQTDHPSAVALISPLEGGRLRRLLYERHATNLSRDLPLSEPATGDTCRSAHGRWRHLCGSSSAISLWDAPSILPQGHVTLTTTPLRHHILLPLCRFHAQAGGVEALSRSNAAVEPQEQNRVLRSKCRRYRASNDR